MISYVFLSIDTITDTDISILSSLFTLFLKRPVQLDHTYLANVLKEARVLVARDESAVIIGSASLYPMTLLARRVGHIEGVVVEENRRGQGIGKQLMQHLIEEARILGLSRLYLTSKPSRETANHLYQSLGFQLRSTNPYSLDL